MHTPQKRIDVMRSQCAEMTLSAFPDAERLGLDLVNL